MSISSVSLTATDDINFLSSSGFSVLCFLNCFALCLRKTSIFWENFRFVPCVDISILFSPGAFAKTCAVDDADRSESRRTIGGNLTRPCWSRPTPLEIRFEFSPSISTAFSPVIGGSFTYDSPNALAIENSVSKRNCEQQNGFSC